MGGLRGQQHVPVLGCAPPLPTSCAARLLCLDRALMFHFSSVELPFLQLLDHVQGRSTPVLQVLIKLFGGAGLHMPTLIVHNTLKMPCTDCISVATTPALLIGCRYSSTAFRLPLLQQRSQCVVATPAATNCVPAQAHHPTKFTNRPHPR